jgi:outer membrane protein OmpA-like peptidoglycan-associated protein
MRSNPAPWLLVVACVVGHIDASPAQELRTFESWVAEAREPEARQAICVQAYNLYFVPVFEKPGGEVPTELSGLWRACEGLLAPSNAVMRQLSLAREYFNRAFPETARWTLVRYLGRVSPSEETETVSAMIKTAVGFASSDGSDARPPRLVRISGDSNLDQAALAQSLRSNLQKEDFLLEVSLRDRSSGETFQTLNSMRPDGNHYSGYLFLTIRLPAAFGDPVELPNTMCQSAMTRNIFGGPADRFEGCVRAACASRLVTSCLVTKAECIPGPMGDCKILPNANTPGDVDQPDCHTAFRYAWSTGLKQIKISGGGVSINIDGSIGQAGQGSFLVEESCSAAPAAPRLLSESFASDVLFDVDEAVLKTEGKQELDRKLVKYLPHLQIVSVVVDGHTDSTYSEAYNLGLSWRRANEIKNYLLASGISSNLIEVHGYGLSKPIASNATREGRAKNRRVEIVVKAQRL